MASSGILIFLAVVDCINVYEAADFSSMNPPDPSTIFPFNPIRSLRATPQQQLKILSRIPEEANTRNTNNQIVINYIKTGLIGEQESLVAVGEFGCILVWNLGELGCCGPVLIESSDLASTWGIAMSPKNFLLATSSNSHAVTIFHFPSGRVIFQQQRSDEASSEVIRIHKHNIPSLDFSPCGKFLASCSIDGQVVLWSLATEEITIIKSSGIEWGWLVRFVPSQQYDFRTSHGKYKYFKSFYYNSNIEEPQTRDYALNENDHEELAVAVDPRSDDSVSYDDLESYLNPIINDNNTNTNYFIDRNDHLAEDAGDTWPSYSEPEEIVDNREYSDYNVTECDDWDDSDSDYGTTNESADDYNTIEGYEMKYLGETIVQNEYKKFKINFLNTSDIILFKNNNSSSNNTPFDLFYCSSESVSVFDPSGRLKLHLPKLKTACSRRQTAEPSNQFLYGMQFLQNRLAMGEWIFELGIFIVVDCNGQVFISSPKQQQKQGDNRSLDLNTTIMIPESFDEAYPIIGYTLIKQFDEEYGVKFHLYIICENGYLKLYEIVKK